MHARWLLFVILILLFIYSHLKLKVILPKKYFINWVLPFLFYALILSEQFIYRYSPAAIDSNIFLALFWLSSFAMGLWGTYIIYSLFLDCFRYLHRFYERFAVQQKTFKPERRLFIKQGVSLGVLAGAGVTSTIGLNTAIQGPKICKINIPVSNLSKELEGFSIAQISDLHVGPTVLKEYVESVVNQTLALSADLIVVTGDLADGTPEILKKHVEPLAKLQAPHGVYYVTGNHEYYWGVDAWLAKVKELGFTNLMNQNISIKKGSANLMIAGVPDTSVGMFNSQEKSDPHQAIQTEEKHDYKILLAHRPDSCFEAETAGFDLQLSGHTHAGQFFPFNIFVSLVYKYYKGLNRHKNMWVYVNSGTGYWGPMNRFLVPSEITLIKLTKEVI